MTELIFNNTSNARGHTVAETKTSTNKLKREARYLPNIDGKVKISFTSKHEAAGEAGEDKEYAQIWERNISVE